MRIALAQMNVIPGALDRNLTTVLDMVATAKLQGVDLIAFPEMALAGYLLSDLWLDRSFCDDLMEYNKQVIAASQDIAIAFGSAFVDNEISARIGSAVPHPNKDGRSRLYNAVFVAQYGRSARRLKETNILPAGVQPKTLLPDYRFFDDQRYFFSLADVALDHAVALEDLAQPFLIHCKGSDIPVGFEVCEDLWCHDYRKDGRALNVTRYLVENGAELIVNISASPWTWRKHDARDRRIIFLTEDMQDKFVPFYYVNNVGAQNNGKNIITFDGGATVYNEMGLPCLSSEKFFEPDLLIADHQRLPEYAHSRHEFSRVKQKYLAIVSGLRYLRDMLGWDRHPGFVVGLSGGIDSATVLALLVAALGRDKIWAVNMPTRYNSIATKNVARKIADSLAVDYLEIPIESLVEAHQTVFAELDNTYQAEEWTRALSDENIQAKIRGTSILSNLAGRYGRMFTNNGNKLEIALGYATLYGDIGGVIAPIGDLTKKEVYDLARFLNESVFQNDVIPNDLFPNDLFEFSADAIAPSAELRDNQIDPMKFGYHCALLEAFTSFKKVRGEDIMHWYLEGEMEAHLNISTALIKRWGIDDPHVFAEDLEWFSDAIRKSVFKRIQAPPIIVTSPSAYGFDIRESQLPRHDSAKYTELKRRVLAMKWYQPAI
jgi:NAD+ synthase (glutamine-hydrolysing)